MIPGEQKIERMVKIARMYYEKDMTQSQIAKELNISRPLVSILLTEAKERGIVTISINDINSSEDKIKDMLKKRFFVNDIVLVPDETIAEATNMSVSEAALTYCFADRNSDKNVGIGLGSMIGRMADFAEKMPKDKKNKGTIFPLAGGVSSIIRGYHTNEMARIFALKSGKTADFLYAPALLDDQENLDYVKHSEMYNNIQHKWNEMDQAIVSISNCPSELDEAVRSYYENSLMENHAVGHLLAYYYDIIGNVIMPEKEGIIQASLEQLKKVEVIAVCSNLVRPAAIIGALRLGVINTLILPVSTAQKVLDYKD